MSDSTKPGRTKIHLRGSESSLEVAGSVEDVAGELARGKGSPTRFETTRGGVVYVNWDNVQYIEESGPPRVHAG